MLCLPEYLGADYVYLYKPFTLIPKRNAQTIIAGLHHATVKKKLISYIIRLKLVANPRHLQVST